MSDNNIIKCNDYYIELLLCIWTCAVAVHFYQLNPPFIEVKTAQWISCVLRINRIAMMLILIYLKGKYNVDAKTIKIKI